MYVDNTWEKVGSTRIDLSEYAKKLDYFIPLNMQTQEIDWTVLKTRKSILSKIKKWN